MPIQPSSRIDLLTNVPLNSSYEHTIYFPSVPAQTSFFERYLFRTDFPVTYNRMHQTLMIQGKADDYYSCNYIRFQNTLYGTKFFYGFVTSVIFVNENTTEIQWEMDYIQSYWFEFTFPQQFVDRCHSVTDQIGDNIIDENIAVGEMMTTGFQAAGYGDCEAIIAVGDTSSTDFTGGRNYYAGNVFSGLDLYHYSMISYEITDLIKKYGTKSSSIAMMYACPTKLLPPTEGKISDGFRRDHEIFQFPKPVFGTPIDNYIPKNAKLYTYPYYFLHVSNNTGEGMPLRYEFFQDDFARVTITGTYLNPVQLKAQPSNYKNSRSFMKTESIVLSGYPQLSWVSDYYEQWIAQNGFGLGLSVAADLMSIGTGIVTGNASGAIGGFMGVLSAMNQQYVASNHADIIRGGMGSSNVNMVWHENDFYFTTYTLNKQMAISIDSYFTRYGYKQNRLMNLVFNARPSFTYIKTFNAHVNGTASNPAKQAIQEALNRGITFWMGEWVGDYTRDNSVSHDPHPDFYTLLVNSGTGSGEFMAGTTVTVIANNAPEGMRFDHWEITFGTIPNPRQSSTSFIMPAGNTVVSAIFVERPKPPPEKWNLALQLHEHLGEVEWSDWISAAQVWMFGSFQTYAWCATIVAYCAYECNCLDQFGVPALGGTRELASTTAMKNRFATMGKLHKGWGYDKSYQPKQGDVLFISWSSNPDNLDHTALCWGFSTEGINQLTYIGGNQGTGATDGITMRTVPNDSKIICWVGEMDNTVIQKP